MKAFKTTKRRNNKRNRLPGVCFVVRVNSLPLCAAITFAAAYLVY